MLPQPHKIGYPFGSSIANRSWSDVNRQYRYGFNGKEKDSETANDNYDFGARIYDGRLAKWLSLDPLMSHFPFCSTYDYCWKSPIRLIDVDGMAPGDPFLTMEDAARDFAMLYNDNSIAENKEYGAYIYKIRIKGKTYYTYNTPTKSWDGGFVIIKRKGVPFYRLILASVHAHGAFRSESDNDFSTQDKAIAKENRYPMFVVTPNGSLKKYDPKTNETTNTELESCNLDIPSDPKDKSRKNENDYTKYLQNEEFQEHSKLGIWIIKNLSSPEDKDIMWKEEKSNEIEDIGWKKVEPKVDN